jgi:membrane protease YdiL (CAAX protease family)
MSIDLEKYSPKHANQKVGWGPWASILVGFASYLVPIIILSIIIAVVAVIRGVSDPNDIVDGNNMIQNVMFSLFVSVAAVTYIFGYVKSRGGLKALGLKDYNLKHYKLVLGAYGVYLVSFISILTFVALFVPSINADQAQDLGFEDPTGFFNLSLVFIALVILPPLYEEILFRGFAFQGMAKAYGFFPAAILINGIFGAAHGQINVGIDTFILGVIASWLVWKTKSLWPAVALHAIKNLVAFIFRFVLMT